MSSGWCERQKSVAWSAVSSEKLAAPHSSSVAASTSISHGGKNSCPNSLANPPYTAKSYHSSTLPMHAAISTTRYFSQGIPSAVDAGFSAGMPAPAAGCSASPANIAFSPLPPNALENSDQRSLLCTRPHSEFSPVAHSAQNFAVAP